jgi:Cof subfamily protein (haloacid dehalogenase superfamily)
VTTFVSDLDGTLLASDASVSDFTRRVIAAVAGSHEVVLATGRPPRLVNGFAEAFPSVTSVVCANGAFHLDLHSGAITQLGTITEPDAHQIVRMILAAQPSARFAVETVAGHRREFGYRSYYDVPHRMKGTIDEILDGGVGKILIHLDEPVNGKRATELSARVGELGVVTVSNPTFYEVAPPGISKASGVAALDLAGETVAYGDMPNDIALLEWADLGVAVANADEQVRLTAQCVLDQTNDEDAVAYHMIKLLGLSLP